MRQGAVWVNVATVRTLLVSFVETRLTENNVLVCHDVVAVKVSVAAGAFPVVLSETSCANHNFVAAIILDFLGIRFLVKLLTVSTHNVVLGHTLFTNQ